MNQTRPVAAGASLIVDPATLARLEMYEGLVALIAAALGIELGKSPRMTGFGGIRQNTPMLVRIP